MPALTIGQVAQRTGLSAKAIRLYEARDLIHQPERTPSGYRVYSEHDAAVLQFVGQARALGLELREVKEILDLQRTGRQPCERVIGLLDVHVREIDQTIADLQALRATLVRVRGAAQRSRRRGAKAVVCQVIEASGTRRRPSRHADRSV
jgi:DNA-binding transcriptional MerR regulator